MKTAIRVSTAFLLGCLVSFNFVSPSQAAFSTMPGWGETAYLFNTNVNGQTTEFTFNVWASVDQGYDIHAGQYRYNYWVENIDDSSNWLWEDFELRVPHSWIIAYGTTARPDGYTINAFPDTGYSERLDGQDVFAAVFRDTGRGLPEGEETDLFWFTSYNAPGSGLAAGQGGGADWIYQNPGSDDVPGPVPEPGTILLLGMGILGAGFAGAKGSFRRKAA